MPRKNPPEAPLPKSDPNDEGRMRVTLEGPAKKVRKQMKFDAGVTPSDDPANGQSKIHQALRNSSYEVMVKRQMPRFFAGRRADLRVAQYECPMEWESIVEDVSTHCGGGTYRVSVHDPEAETPKPIAARTFDVPGDPILPPEENPDLSAFINPPPQDNDPNDAVQQIKNQINLTQQQLTLEQSTQQLDELKGRKTQGKSSTAEDERIRKLELDILRLGYEKQIDGLKQKVDNLAQAKPTAEAQESPTIALLTRLIESQDKKFDSLVAQMRDQKLEALSQQIADLKHRSPTANEGSSLKDAVSTVKDLMGMMGYDSKDKDDEEEEGEWYEVLVKKIAPRVLDLLDRNKKEGKSLSKEELVSEVSKMADEEIARKVAAAKSQMAQQVPPQQVIPQPPAQQLPPAAPVQGVLPPLATNPPPQLPAVPAAPPAQLPAPPVMSVEQERAFRASKILEIIDRESQLRPRDYQWSLLAWYDLDEDTLEKVAVATDTAQIFVPFEAIPGLNPDDIKTLAARIVGNEKVARWLARGVADLKEWLEKSRLNPKFDPDPEEEEEVSQEVVQ